MWTSTQKFFKYLISEKKSLQMLLTIYNLASLFTKCLTCNEYILWNVFQNHIFLWDIKLIWACYSRSGVVETKRSINMFQLKQNWLRVSTGGLNLVASNRTPGSPEPYWNIFNLMLHSFAEIDKLAGDSTLSSPVLYWNFFSLKWNTQHW
jgi:hypothetical protein